MIRSGLRKRPQLCMRTSRGAGGEITRSPLCTNIKLLKTARLHNKLADRTKFDTTQKNIYLLIAVRLVMSLNMKTFFSAHIFALLCSVDLLYCVCEIVLLIPFRWRNAANTFLDGPLGLFLAIPRQRNFLDAVVTKQIRPSTCLRSSGAWFLALFQIEEGRVSVCRNVGYVIQRANRETWELSVEGCFNPGILFRTGSLYGVDFLAANISGRYVIFSRFSAFGVQRNHKTNLRHLVRSDSQHMLSTLPPLKEYCI
jgi:hypothetical protein